MADKYFKKIYSDRIAFGKCLEGDSINYNEPSDGKYTTEFITKTQYTDGVNNMSEIPKTREQIIQAKIEEIAIQKAIDDGDLDINGELK